MHIATNCVTLVALATHKIDCKAQHQQWLPKLKLRFLLMLAITDSFAGGSNLSGPRNKRSEIKFRIIIASFGLLLQEDSNVLQTCPGPIRSIFDHLLAHLSITKISNKTKGTRLLKQTVPWGPAELKL